MNWSRRLKMEVSFERNFAAGIGKGLDLESEPIQTGHMSQIPLVRRSPVPTEACNLARAIDLIGDRWTLLILRSALYGVRRFDDFQSELGCPRTVLSGRLKKLVDAGLLTRKSYKAPGKRARPEYVLSATGLSLRPILIGLTQWGDAWLGQGEAPPISFTKAGSKSAIRAAFVDVEGREVRPDQIRAVLRG
jgi:DNA-binding HxlR family transcriptional regulator